MLVHQYHQSHGAPTVGTREATARSAAARCVAACSGRVSAALPPSASPAPALLPRLTRDSRQSRDDCHTRRTSGACLTPLTIPRWLCSDFDFKCKFSDKTMVTGVAGPQGAPNPVNMAASGQAEQKKQSGDNRRVSFI